MRILITGSTGFLGGSVGRFAAGGGHHVIGVARRSQPDASWPGAHVAADVATADMAGIVDDARPDLIFHGAGTASVGASFSTPLDDLRASTMTLANVLDGVRRSTFRPLIVFPSSAAVYGNPATLPVAETAPLSPISPYGFHKLACEIIAEEYSRCFGLSTLICRIFSVFGPSQRRLLVWDIYQQLVGANETVELRGTGNETRDYLYVDDLAAGMIALAQTVMGQKENAFQVFNLASGNQTAISTFAADMGRLVPPVKPVVCRGNTNPGDPMRWCADMSKTTARIPGWQPRPVQQALENCIAAWQAHTA